MKTPELENYEIVSVHKCKTCSVIKKNEDEMKDHMKRKHCQHKNIIVGWAFKDLEFKCVDCNSTIYPETRSEFEIINIDDVVKYYDSILSLGASKTSNDNIKRILDHQKKRGFFK